MRDTTPSPTQFVSSRSLKRRHDNVTRDDFDDFKEEIRQMFASIQDKMDNSLASIEKSLEAISLQHDEFRTKIKTLEKNCLENHKYITTLEEKVEELLRVSKLTTVELRNVPYKVKENKMDLTNYVTNISKSLNINVQPSDIYDIYRLPGRKDSKKDSNRPIIIQLSHLYVKNSLIKAVKDLNRSNQHNKLNLSHAGIEGNTSPIYLTENLTVTARKLFYLARQLKKQKKIKYCWITDGKVLVRKVDGDQSILVKSESQIEALSKDA